jgi:hypothetical protein
VSIRPLGRVGALARPFSILLVALAAALTPACRGRGVDPARAAGTNVLLVSIDTLRRDHLPAYGYPRATAPALDRLATQSVVFDTAIAVHTNTAPAHSSMLSGLYPATHGAWSN